MHSSFPSAGMIETSRPQADERGTAEALFGLGLALPLFAGGNTLFALEPMEGIYIVDTASILASWLILRSRGVPASAPRGAARMALGCLLALGVWWIAALIARPCGPRAYLEAQAILCATLLFATLARCRLTAHATTRFVRGLLLGTLGTAAFGQYQYWIAFPRTIPLAHAAGIPAFGLVNANFYNANCYGVFLASVILLAAGLAISERDAWVWAAIPLLVVTVLLSKSRASIVLLAIAGTGLGAIAGRRPNRGGGSLATVVLWVLLPAAAGAAAGAVDLGEIWRVATMGRIAIWSGSLEVVREHWLLGVGLGRFGTAFAQRPRQSSA
jgi:hypothetical protein